MSDATISIVRRRQSDGRSWHVLLTASPLDRPDEPATVGLSARHDKAEAMTEAVRFAVTLNKAKISIYIEDTESLSENLAKRAGLSLTRDRPPGVDDFLAVAELEW